MYTTFNPLYILKSNKSGHIFKTRAESFFPLLFLVLVYINKRGKAQL